MPEDIEFLFPGIDHRVRFIVLTIARARAATGEADLSFANRSVAALADRSRHFSLTPQDFATLNPNTRTCATFRSRRDADINLALYRRTGILWREADEENGNPWRLRFMQGLFNMASDSGLFRTRAQLEADGYRLVGNHFFRGSNEYVPLIEAKMVHHFDHRFGTYEGQTQAQDNQGKLPELGDAAHADAEAYTQPYYWVPASAVDEQLRERWARQWLLGFRDICRSTDQRTVLSSLIPRAGVGHKFPLLLSTAAPTAVACLYANLSSFALDYTARQKLGGTSLTYFVVVRAHAALQRVKRGLLQRSPARRSSRSRCSRYHSMASSS